MRIDELNTRPIVSARLRGCAPYHVTHLDVAARAFASTSAVSLETTAATTAVEKRNRMFWAGRPTGHVAAPPG